MNNEEEPLIKVISVNISDKKGIVKTPVNSIEINQLGVVGDAHAGEWHRQVSLLGLESYSKTEQKITHRLPLGSFAENITTEGFLLHQAAIFDRFICRNVELEISQIGKKCHHGCNIKQLVGECVMPVEGIFCKVIKPGIIKEGDIFRYIPRILNVKILTLSDRAYKGVYEDISGAKVRMLLETFFKENRRHYEIENILIPDESVELAAKLEKFRNEKVDILITTGGTGIGPRDITPDIVKKHLDKEIPGIMELIRVKYGMQKPNALISRSIAGVMGNTLVYVLPGSVKAVEEYMSEITPTIEHSLRMLNGIDNH